ncbi:MAG: kynureninase [Rhodoferax sp.]|nr:kynureninase [Betaproteobacteria bacterium]NCN97477.1 kynureninase [Rhodoferax sp.]PIZ23802.1 MAG: kynureninase [Comamonadaceae bacterium CG_4_10_14_0_8_um_filter_57_29]PJC21257.1 MAG: kynureninase [Comamonadaceae bacterium CG_4_9_14_0_8_um_filter_57_21]NCP82903.1 kynureninase [Rhodoferax sp.]
MFTQSDLQPALTLAHCQALDVQDLLRPLRDAFDMPSGVIYLDGNSLGALPKTTAARVAEVVTQEWGQGLIRSWNSANWFTLPQRLGDKIARLIGADAGEVVATDSTSINLYKVLSSALSIAAQDAPLRKQVLSERSNFPTDLYMAQALCQERGFELRLIDADALAGALNDQVAVLMLTHVNYRTGAMHDMAAVTAAAHAAGVLTVWDLAHSAGAVPVALKADDADFAIGCGYKYLNGGPGAPAFVWVHPRHSERFWQPLAGWWGHATPFEFTPDYRPAPGITRYLCGTQPMLSLAALECGLDVFASAQAMGGMAALRAKSLALTDLFIALVEQRCSGHGLGLATPREHTQRGSQVCLTRSEGAYAMVQALIARGVIGDFRAGDGHEQPDILRFGFTPLYLGFEEVWNAVEQLRQVLDTQEWKLPAFTQKQAVT